MKKQQLSDLTLFRLNQPNTPYSNGVPDLMHIRMLLAKTNRKKTAGHSTTEYVDYALLISDSKANEPLDLLEFRGVKSIKLYR